ncbi:hypothetical protein PV327_009079 [Microctonus hyperodae]|uniref:BTB domain-containing protein n=1 Tax=Microctonus hyperodae TaxID=165561 RepID=A0AA39FT13_MICHY|nr:hypothetical protein PV327_009079 [Microctonus hyperodae]
MQKEAMLNLRWDFFPSQLTSTLDMCYGQQYFVDTSLVCKDGTVLKCHKMILAGASTFFQRLLVKNDHPHPMIILHDIEADDLRTIINFIYCGEIEVVKSEVRRLLKIAQILEISGLKDIKSFGQFEEDFSPIRGNTSTIVNNFKTTNIKNQGDIPMVVQPSKSKHQNIKIKSNYNLRQRNVANKENNIEKHQRCNKKNDGIGRGNAGSDASCSNKSVIPSNNDVINRPSTSKCRKRVSIDEKPSIKRLNAVDDCKYLKKLKLLNEVEVICKSHGENGSISNNRKSPDERSRLDCGMFIKEEIDISSDEEFSPRLSCLKRMGRRKRILYPGVEIFRVATKSRNSLPSTSRTSSNS